MKYLLFSLSTLLLLILTACGGASSISVDKNSVSFAIDGGEENVSVTADGSWNVKDCPDWVKTETQEGVIIIKAERNETGAAREGNIVLQGKSNVEATITVKQFSKCTHITPASDEVEFEKEGGTETINIDTDGSNINVEAPDGFSATFADGVLSVTAPTNEEGAKRGEIKLTCDNQSATIYASQKGSICPTCRGTGKVKCKSCGGKGYVTHAYSDDWEDDYGCSDCGGSGKDDGSLKLGSGRVKCPDCGGTGH
ncbi:MAG: hypothetical protein IJR20_04660 [Muribaculaceae bacterium]|nr:hypothetical protein [Muribaculaceae bacterium]